MYIRQLNQTELNLIQPSHGVNGISNNSQIASSSIAVQYEQVVSVALQLPCNIACFSRPQES